MEPATFEYQPGRGIRATFGADRIIVGAALLLADEDVEVPAEALGNDLTDVAIADFALGARLHQISNAHAGTVDVVDGVVPAFFYALSER